jgi:trigger factor
LKITAERQPESQVLLEIEVEPERVEKSMDQAFRRMSGRYRIPGFRPGKAPRVMFERYVGRDTLLREALEKLVPQVYEEAIKEESLDPIDQPSFEIPTFEPLLIKATVPVKPTVDLGDYRSLRLPREEATVSPEQLEETMLNLRRQYATLTPVERPAQAGDVVRADLKAEVEGRELISEEDTDLRLTEQGMQGLPGLLDRLIGVEKGKEYTFEVAVPEDFDQPNLAGKQATYRVMVKEIKEEQLPEPDDAFASEVGEGFPSYAALCERFEGDLKRRAEEQAERDYDQKIVETLIAQSTIEFPPVLVDREIDHILSEQTGGGTRASVEAALRKSGGSADALVEQVRPLALERVKRSLVLTEVAEREGISVGDAEVDAELDRIAGDSPQAAQMRSIFDNPSGRELLSRTALTKKVYQRLRDIAEGKELPPLPEPAAAAGEASSETAEPVPEAENGGAATVTEGAAEAAAAESRDTAAEADAP